MPAWPDRPFLVGRDGAVALTYADLGARLAATEHAPVLRPAGTAEALVGLVVAMVRQAPLRLVDAAAELRKRGADRIKILLVGDGSEKARLQERVRREGLDNVIFIPPVRKRELAALTASLGCGLMVLRNVPAFYRGTSPNKFFDYLAAGIPVVNNYPGWLADIITRDSCGLAVPPGSPAAMADALQRLAADPSLRAELGARARATGERDFDRSTLAARFADFLSGHSPTDPS